MKSIIKTFIGIAIIMLFITSCKKFLDVKPDSSLSTVATLNDAQLLLNNTNNINYAGAPYFGEWSADNYYFPQSTYDNLGINQYGIGEIYVWGKYPFLGYTNASDTGWGQIYSAVMVTNIVLEALNKIKSNDNSFAFNSVKGEALAFRGYFFWKLVTSFSKSYNEQSASTDLGIPLRLNSNFNEKSTRASVAESYGQIVKDLKAALSLLSIEQSNPSLPSKPCVYAMLSEVYLSMRKYDVAKLYADSTLALRADLINYNTLNKMSTSPLPVVPNNKEVLIMFQTGGGTSWYLSQGSYAVDTALYASYKSNDLRKKFFYQDNGDGTNYFSGNYVKDGFVNTGPTTSEMYLTRAECLARAGDITSAMKDLNTLMKNRIEQSPLNPYQDYVASSSTGALKIILEERRKELAFRDLRWMDIKRLNLEGANIVLTRKINGKTYTLSPNDNRYAIQIPQEVVQLSGVPQNPY